MATIPSWTKSVSSVFVPTLAPVRKRKQKVFVQALLAPTIATTLNCTLGKKLSSETKPHSLHSLGNGKPKAIVSHKGGCSTPGCISPRTDGLVQEERKTTTIRIHYHRRDGNYKNWGLHLWGDTKNATPWERPLSPTGSDDTFGVYWDITEDLNGVANFLIHKGEEKDCSGTFSTSTKRFFWLVSDCPLLFAEKPDLASLPKGSLHQARAYWVKDNILAWPSSDEGDQFYLYSSETASLRLGRNGVENSDAVIQLDKSQKKLPEDVIQKFPHLKNYIPLMISDGYVGKELLKCQLAVTSFNGSGKVLAVSGVQIAAVLDDMFAYDGPLGVTIAKGNLSMHLWAPTAQNVRLLLFSLPSGGEPEKVIQAKENNGVWLVHGPVEWVGMFYLYEITVFHPVTQKIEISYANDPYSRGLSANGERSLIVDLSDEGLKPEGWDRLGHRKPKLKAFRDIAIYELHIRDFSAIDQTVDSSIRGTYCAFAEKNSLGVKHLKKLAEAGLTHVHLLPSFDFGSVNERNEEWKSVDYEKLALLPPDSEDQQCAVVEIQDEDGYNWGYDPVNWGVPEGSYSTDPDGAKRTLEYRTMVQSLSDLGLRVIMDVVYNHIHENGPNSGLSVLDKVVPGYYLRRNKDGDIENSTCTNNTASEHYMVDRLIVDDLLHWVIDYKVDGFRFDLMGHLMKRTMTRAKVSLQALTLEKDGVDGSKIYLYGEGWDFGEVANNGRGVNAAQSNLAGTGIGSFNDRIRDAALGGSPFGDPLRQGFLTGLYLEPNSLEQGNEETMKNDLLTTTDHILLGIAGNLRDFTMINHNGKQVKGTEVLMHDGRPVAYASQPEETINYVSAHDNETLFDIIQMKCAKKISLEDRCRINHLATSIIALSQGIPFFHAGDEILRSKSLDRDSYKSGDWFNRLDFTYESTNWGIGLPPKAKNGNKWPFMRKLLSNPSLKPKKQNILSAVENFLCLLRIRFSSPLFRLTANEIHERLTFHNTGPDAIPGVIFLNIKDGDGVSGLKKIDNLYEQIVVVFNARPSNVEVNVSLLTGRNFTLHPVLVTSSDEVVKKSSYDSPSGTFRVPARTTAVFVESCHKEAANGDYANGDYVNGDFAKAE